MEMREAPWSAVAPATALFPPSERRQLGFAAALQGASRVFGRNGERTLVEITLGWLSDELRLRRRACAGCGKASPFPGVSVFLVRFSRLETKGIGPWPSPPGRGLSFELEFQEIGWRGEGAQRQNGTSKNVETPGTAGGFSVG